jgi:hypothetical protein
MVRLVAIALDSDIRIRLKRDNYGELGYCHAILAATYLEIGTHSGRLL